MPQARRAPTGTIVAIAGTDFAVDGANLPTAGTVTGSGFDDTLHSFSDTDTLEGLAGFDYPGRGPDTIDGGGNNFLTGGAGRNTFFLDGRFLVPVWSCITDWEVGEPLTLWGWTAGYLGATMFANIDGNGLVETAITWTGKTRAELPTPTETTVSSIGVLLFGYGNANQEGLLFL